jgi:thiol-disulfide isomerase/thioredoxin
MIRFYFIIFTLFSFVGLAQVQNYEEGEVVADFTVTDINGQEHNLYSYTAEGKYVFIDFFYKDCGGCQVLAPIFNEFYDKYGCNEGDVVCLLINRGVDNDEAVIEFEALHGGDFYHAPAISRNGGAIDVDSDLNPYAYPTVCIIAPDNTLFQDKVWPINDVEDIEAAFPEDFYPEVLNCTLGTLEPETLLDFEVFPNPVTGTSFDLIIKDYQKMSFRIINILGKEVFASDIKGVKTKVYLEEPQGVYFLEVRSKQVTRTIKILFQ